MSNEKEDNLESTKNLDPNGANSQNDSISYGSSHPDKLDRIGRYLVLQQLGSGAFGIVFRAQDEVLKRFVAIKLLTRFQSPGQVDAWVEEARVLASLDHPAIVPVFDIGKTESGQPYIVSKLINGGSLSERASSQNWSIEDSVRVVTQLAKSLDYLHRRGVMHRDIKPSNILTTEEGNAVLADFGLALPETGFGKGSRFVGTPAYMSPEQARHEGHRVDGRSDIYSLGVVFYELLTGTRPFRAINLDELLECIRNIEVRPLRQISAGVPRELERICLKALSKKVSERYSTASDLVEDLEHWSDVPATQTNRATTAYLVENPMVESASNSQSLDLDSIAVVPHGLRAFDSGDSDFFRYLLPGARDRNGFPDSINFWLQRIQSRNPSTFRVGVLLGLSGSGKSSLIRAGILPLVRDTVTTIYVEAKPEELEFNILKQIRRELPQYAAQTSLRETLIRFRQQNKEGSGKKLLVVIDQFEQWLNHHRDAKSTEFHESLRQCDGTNIQAILLVRDDFMLGISSFMDQLDELLLQNQNFATVEPFGVLHAKKVLAAFGRAYGTLRDPLTSEQSAFIDEAIDGLANIGRLEPVQIALLSDMIKGKPWNLSTLRELGGIQGMGVTFLEEKLAGPSSHPLLRSQLPVVQRILRELLPADDTVIKPPACAQSVMLERLEGIASKETLAKLLQLIDTEVRLITPTSSNSMSSSATSSSIGNDPAYQLTHDYLVPTTRKWLETQNSGTRAGRVREQLRDIATVWNARPAAKRLPTVFEWLAIRWLSSSKQWTAPERKMMRCADRRLAWMGTAIISVLVLVLYFGNYAYREIQSSILANRLLDVGTGDVSEVLRQIEPHRRWVLPKLKQFEGSINQTDQDDLTSASRKRLHIGLAQFDDLPDQMKYVLSHLGDVEDRHLASVLDYIKTRRTIDNNALFEQTRHSLRERSPEALPLAALLCQREPNHAGLQEIANDLCELLARKPTIQLGFWPELLMPLRDTVVPHLFAIGERNQGDQTASVDSVVSLIAAFSKEDETSFARAIGWASVEQLPALLSSRAGKEILATELRDQLSQSTIRIRRRRPSSSGGASIPVEQSNFVKPLDGYLSDSGGWTERVPMTRLEEIVNTMRQFGFVPNSIRPYLVDETQFAAITWQLGKEKSWCELNLTESELLNRFQELKRDGYSMMDFASYSQPPDSTNLSEPRWLGLWSQNSQGDSGLQVLLLGEDDTMRNSKGRKSKVLGLVPIRYGVRVAERGNLLHDSLWARPDQESPESVEWTRLEFANGDVFPGYIQTDIRCVGIRNTKDRSRKWGEYAVYLSSTNSAGEIGPRDALNVVSRLSACGELEEAWALLVQLAGEDMSHLPVRESGNITRGLLRNQARTLARMGRLEELRDLFANKISLSKIAPDEKDYYAFRLAVLEKDSSKAKQFLDSLESYSENTTVNRDLVVRALGVLASQDFSTELAESAFAKLLETVPKMIAKDRELTDCLLECDFDSLKPKPEWRALLERCSLTRRNASCAQNREGVESRAIYAKSLFEHKQDAMEMISLGFVPVSWHVDSETNAKGVATSVWHRPKATNASIVTESRRAAILTLSLANLGEPDSMLEGLSGKFGKSVQTDIIALTPRLIAGDELVLLLRNATLSTLQTSLVSALGGYMPNDFSESNFRYLKLRIRGWAEAAAESHLLNTSRWCLSHWNEPEEPLKPKQSYSPDRTWFTNSLGQQLIWLDPPSHVKVGKSEEQRFWVHIGRRFAIAANEVTGDEFAEFLKDPRVEEWIGSQRKERSVSMVEPTMPQPTVSWELGIRYCQWLNEREGVPANQWCYKNVWSQDGTLPIPEPQYLERTGYRLPTHAEWEWACAAGLEEPWHFGVNESNIFLFEWILPKSQNELGRVRSLRPNQFGLFDMGGNLAEWTDDYYRTPERETKQYFFDDQGNLESETSPKRVLAGGRFRMGAASALTNAFTLNESNYISPTTGIRIARTIAKNP